MRGRAGIALVVLLTATSAALIAFLEPILPLHLFTTENAGSGTIGLIFGAAGVAAAVAPPLAGMALRRMPPGLVAAAGCALAAAALLALGGGVHGVLPVAAGLAAVVFGASLVITPTVTVMSEIAEEQQPPAYGSVYALYTLAYTGGLAVAPLCAGWAMQELGFDGAARTAAVVAVLLAVVIVLASHRTSETSPTRALASGDHQKIDGG